MVATSELARRWWCIRFYCSATRTRPPSISRSSHHHANRSEGNGLSLFSSGNGPMPLSFRACCGGSHSRYVDECQAFRSWEVPRSFWCRRRGRSGREAAAYGSGRGADGWRRRPVTGRVRRDAAAVGREQPGTTGLKVHCECNGGSAFPYPLARLRRAELKLLHQNSNCTTDTVSPISRIPQEHNLTMVNVTPILQPDFWGYVWSGLVGYAGDQVDAANT